MASDEYACPKCHARAKKADALGSFMGGQFSEMAGKGHYSSEKMQESLEGLLIGGSGSRTPSGRVSCWKCGHSIDIQEIFAGKHDVGACFIATAVYGGAEAPELAALRRYRDRRLRVHAAGRVLIAAYERLGPPLARWVSRRPGLRRLLRPIFDGLSAAARRSMLEEDRGRV